MSQKEGTQSERCFTILLSVISITYTAYISVTYAHVNWERDSYSGLASFPGSPSFRARMTFDPPEGKAEGEPGRFCHMTSVMLRHPYIRYRRGRTASMSLYLCIVGIGLRSETKNFLR